ncbi:hypothetical protein PFISCL1PPCAC_14027, partial [Pristionchus fissidentatus]
MTRRCCCGSLRVTTGAQILAVLLIVRALATMISAIFQVNKYETATRIGMEVQAVFELIAAILVLIACHQRLAKLIMPMMVYTFLSLIGVSIFFILCVYGLFDQHSIVPNWIR